MTTLAFIGMMNAAQAQCDSVTTYEVDKFSGKGTWSSKEPIIISEDGVNGMSMILLMADDKHETIIWVTTSTEVGCVDKGDKIELVFTDETRMTLYSDGSFNCKGKATLYFGSIFGKKTEMQKLASTPISMIRVHGSTSLHSETLKSETSNYFMNAFNCLVQQKGK